MGIIVENILSFIHLMPATAADAPWPHRDRVCLNYERWRRRRRNLEAPRQELYASFLTSCSDLIQLFLHLLHLHQIRLTAGPLLVGCAASPKLPGKVY